MKIDVNGREQDIPVWLYVPLVIIAAYMFFKEASVKSVHRAPLDCKMIKDFGSYADDIESGEDRRDRYERETYDLGGNTLYIREDGLVINYKAFKC